ncbi:MAG: acyl carrier protein [Thermoanaerobaculia bacterium]
MGDADAIRQKIIEELLEASESSLDASEIEAGTNLRDDLGLDSLQAVTVVMALEQEFGVEVDDEEIDGLQTVGDILELLAQKTAAV